MDYKRVKILYHYGICLVCLAIMGLLAVSYVNTYHSKGGTVSTNEITAAYDSVSNNGYVRAVTKVDTDMKNLVFDEVEESTALHNGKIYFVQATESAGKIGAKLDLDTILTTYVVNTKVSTVDNYVTCAAGYFADYTEMYTAIPREIFPEDDKLTWFFVLVDSNGNDYPRVVFEYDEELYIY